MHWSHFSFMLCDIHCLSPCCLPINLLIYVPFLITAIQNTFCLISCPQPCSQKMRSPSPSLRRSRPPPSDVNSINHPLCLDISLPILSWLRIRCVFLLSTENLLPQLFTSTTPTPCFTHYPLHKPKMYVCTCVCMYVCIIYVLCKPNIHMYVNNIHMYVILKNVFFICHTTSLLWPLPTY